MIESYAIADLTWEELDAATDETGTLLLPVGSTEQHGPHLPLGVDTFMPEAVCRRIAERSPCLLAPAIPYGVSPHHTFKPGTVTVESETFRRYVRDVCVSAGEWGIENVLLVNGHYLVQDPELEIVVRDLRTDHGIRAFHVPLVTLFADVASEIRESELSFHASEFETSMMLALFPELVEMDRAEPVAGPDESLPLTDYDALGDNEVGWALSAEEMDELTPTGNLGDPTAASAEAGEALVERVVSKTASLVEALEGSG
ncbi:creatininase family protein [Halalkalicoccus tibetensis]|uniref:Creatininase family protein n=1 Tax=Halalkalicoccus tibetensis TaxID=175632 RepID=A0ABD5V615_9EURY